MLESAIKNQVEEERELFQDKKGIKKHLKSNGIENVGVKGREKNIYSIYRKIKSA